MLTLSCGDEVEALGLPVDALMFWPLPAKSSQVASVEFSNKSNTKPEFYAESIS